MTIVVGFLTGDATILLTDSQEVISDYSKTTTQKIQLMNYYGNWRLGIAAAADDATYATAFVTFPDVLEQSKENLTTVQSLRA